MIKNCSFLTRVKMFYLDITFCFVLSTIFLISILLVGELFVIIFGETLRVLISDIGFYMTVFVFLLLLIFKGGIFHKKSFSEKILKIKIIDKKTLIRPTIKKIILRNIFFPIIGIDLLFSLIRFDCLSLSDLITKTRVVYKIDPDMVEDTRD